MRFRQLLTVVGLIAVATITLTACTQAAPVASPSSSVPVAGARPSPTPVTSVASVGTVANVQVSNVDVYDAPNGTVTTTLANPQESGAPLTFLVVSSQQGWIEVKLPVRPNGSTGWIKADTVSLQALVYSLRVSIADNTLSLYKNSELVKSYSVATGTGGTPTPVGDFYLTELLAPTNSGYGPYAFGLSAFSDALTSFGGGPGQIGLHGTDDESTIGQAVSHGCIRLANQDITELAQLLPLGTPIQIE